MVGGGRLKVGMRQVAPDIVAVGLGFRLAEGLLEVSDGFGAVFACVEVAEQVMVRAIVGEFQLFGFEDAGCFALHFVGRIGAVEGCNGGILPDKQAVVEVQDGLPFFGGVFLAGVPVGDGGLEVVGAGLGPFGGAV